MEVLLKRYVSYFKFFKFVEEDINAEIDWPIMILVGIAFVWSLVTLAVLILI